MKKEILAQVCSSEFSEIFKNTLFTEYLRTTAFEKWKAPIFPKPADGCFCFCLWQTWQLYKCTIALNVKQNLKEN